MQKSTVSSFYGVKPGSGISKVLPVANRQWLEFMLRIREKSKGPNLFLTWRVFHRQEAAFKAVDSSSEPLRIFSFEVDSKNPGKRKFLVTTYKSFWTKYCEMKPDERVFYELIRENAPCKLYFDLEYAKALNRDVDEDRIMRVFTSFVLQELHSMFKIQASLDNIVDLSSSTDTKFSRHLVFNLPKNVVWKDNSHVGRFVSSLTMKILSEKRSLEALEPKTTDQRARLDDLSCLFIQTEAGPSLFIDDGVYSKNRNFRVFQSTKIGKSAFLQRFGSPENSTVDPSLCDYFLSTLVSSVTWTHRTRVLQMHPPMNPKDGNVIDVGINPKGRGLCTSSPMKDVSPFPDIDSFLVSWIQRSTTSTITSVIIKSVLCFSDQKLLLYSISGNKFCFNIMREHKSNGVYYTVDLKRGIFNQRCHDPDYRHFMSKDEIIPLALNPFYVLEDIVDDHTGTASIERKHVKEVDNCWDDISESDLATLNW